MEKYEFNIKAEQMQKMVSVGDFKTAMQIADGIDWRRVRNANMLATVSDIYEKNGEYEEAKEILMMAYQRAPVGTRFLYRLSEISILAGDLQEAEEFYREFCNVGSEDSRVYLLRYLILKAKGAGAEQLSGLLEEYTSLELDEKWLYELAVTYQQAGMIDKCVRICDRITLLFGSGQYVEQAIRLKQMYQPLSRQQQEIVLGVTKQEVPKAQTVMTSNSVPEEEDYLDDPEDASEAESYLDDPEEQSGAVPEEATAQVSGPDTMPEASVTPQVPEEAAETPTPAEKPVVSSLEERGYSQATLAALGIGLPKEKPVHTQQVIKDMISGDAAREEISETKLQQEVKEPEVLQEAAPQAAVSEEPSLPSYHMIIEAESMEEGFRVAVNEIKYFHEKYGLDYKVAKINAEKLNANGFSVFLERLKGRDLIVEHAGDLSDAVIAEMSNRIAHPFDATSIVLVDVEDRFDSMADRKPEFIQLFELVSALPEKEEPILEEVDLEAEQKPTLPEAAPAPVQEMPEVKSAAVEPQEDEATEQEKLAAQIRASLERPSRPLEETERVEPERVDDGIQAPVFDKAEDALTLDQFVEHAMEYAKLIDCAIPEKAEKALYEKAEIMEEDGVRFTKQAAEDLIESAADKAEKPKLFRAKYNKEDKLVLYEDCFL